MATFDAGDPIEATGFAITKRLVERLHASTVNSVSNLGGGTVVVP